MNRPSIEKLAEIAECSQDEIRTDVHQLMAMLEADMLELPKEPRGFSH